MELDAAKQLILKYEALHQAIVMKARVAMRYYAGQNDIKMRKDRKDCCEEGANPLRQADNKLAFNFHALLVDQKASYLFTAPPLFDVGDDETNQLIVKTLGDRYAKTAKDLCIDASNTGVAWVHYWRGEDGNFHWAPVPSIQIYPIYSTDLSRELKAVLRSYKMIGDDGKEWDIYEIWNDQECETYKRQGETFLPCNMFSLSVDGMAQPTNVLRHELGAVPFIAFPNNTLWTSDLDKIKDMVDSYDKTFSGFVDDLEDVQQIILVLTNYGGQDLNEFLRDLKYYKAIQVDSTGDGDKSGVSTLSIEIPVEARDKLLELTRKSIFDMGQGIDPQQQSFDKTSGEAMKFLYSLLELKSGLMETEFRLGFGDLIRAICRFYGKQEPVQIIQTWTRTSIRNDAELVQMCQQSVGIVSTKTILKNHPFVENAEDEEKELAAEKKAKQKEIDAYQKAFGQVNNQQGTGETNGKQQ